MECFGASLHFILDESSLFCGDYLDSLTRSLANKTLDCASKLEICDASMEALVATEADPAAPEEEWKQVLIFFVCFLGIGMLIEVFFIVCLKQSLFRGRNEATPEGSLSEPLVDNEIHVVKSSLSIFNGPNIPLHAKVLVPFFLVVTIGLFISSNTSVGAAVNLRLQWHEKLIWPPWKQPHYQDHDYGPFNLFNFSLVNTIQEMYKAGVYILALLVLAWSGIWPYLKLVLLLAMWFLPPRYLSVQNRGNMGTVFDYLGKWCLMDVFLMVMMSVAFRFYIKSSEIPYLKTIMPGSVVLDVAVQSEWGMYGFVTAAMLSLVMNHVVLAYHRTALANDVSDFLEHEISPSGASQSSAFCCPCPDRSWFNVGSSELVSTDKAYLLDRKISIQQYEFIASDSETMSKFTFRTGTKIFLAVTLLLVVVLIFVGAHTDSFEFIFTGIAGKLIGFAQPESLKRSYSMITIVQALNPGTDTLVDVDHGGLLFLQIIYLSFAFVMPLVQCGFLLALWVVPMRLRDQKIVFDVMEIVSSWAALDVFIVSIIASVVQINQFA